MLRQPLPTPVSWLPSSLPAKTAIGEYSTVEQWRDIPGYEGRYEVSNMGRVYSHMRGGRVLRAGRIPSGYMTVALGRGNTRCVHDLVLTAFVGPRPEGHEARHLNGVPDDNQLLNLEWALKSVNGQDKKWHDGGLNQKLTGVQATEIKNRTSDRLVDLANEFGVSVSTVKAIRAGVFHNDC